jgi:ABC-type polysaccharide/polyol phosphate export permease
MAAPVVAVLERQMVLFRRLWQASVFSSLVIPTLVLVSFGAGVGGYVGGIGGVDYLSWIAPGVLAATVFQIGIGEATYPVYSSFHWVRSYHAQAATPVRPVDMIVGVLGNVVVRAEVSVLAFLAVTAGFGAVHSPWAAVTPLICALVAVAMAAPVTALAAMVEHENHFPLVFRFVMIPSTLFAGVFFPVGQLPVAVRPLAHASPLWHGVELCRAAMLGRAAAWPAAGHAGYLLAWSAAGFAAALYAFRRRLRDLPGGRAGRWSPSCSPPGPAAPGGSPPTASTRSSAGTCPRCAPGPRTGCCWSRGSSSRCCTCCRWGWEWARWSGS